MSGVERCVHPHYRKASLGGKLMQARYDNGAGAQPARMVALPRHYVIIPTSRVIRSRSNLYARRDRGEVFLQ